jgi:hypothetical protein
MRKLLISAALVSAISASAHAEAPDWRDWYQKALSVARSLIQPRRPDPDVIAAPRGLDRQMALTPPDDRSHMPVIAPPH